MLATYLDRKFFSHGEIKMIFVLFLALQLKPENRVINQNFIFVGDVLLTKKKIIYCKANT